MYFKIPTIDQIYTVNDILIILTSKFPKNFLFKFILSLIVV